MNESPDMIQAIILGILQGATEFIPVSSSGHLVIAPWLLGWEKPSLLFDTMLHWGTLAAIFIVFWRDFLAMIRAWFLSLAQRSLANPDARVAWFILAGTLPAVFAALMFEEPLEAMFLNPSGVGFFLLVTAALLFISEQVTRRRSGTGRTLEQMTWLDAIVVGVAQAFALLPGVSRSGSTIAAGLGCGIQRDQAARYSFLLGSPAFFGAGLLQIVKVIQADTSALNDGLLPIAVGFVVSAISGTLAIHFLLRYLRTRTLYVFSVYCLGVGLLTIVLSMLQL